MNKTNLKPLAWALLGAGVAVMGTAGALDLPSWLRHSSSSNAVVAPGAGGGTAAIAAAATGQQVAPTPVTPPLPALPPGTAPNYRAIVQEFGPAVVHVSVEGTHKPTNEELQEQGGMSPDDPLFRFFRGMPGMPNIQRGGQAAAQPFKGLGSGFIIGSDGLILTNAHVVKEAKDVTVKLQDRREYVAKVLGVDTATDIAVLKIDAKGLPTVRFGQPAKLMVGDYVLAIGAPYGLDQTATSGIISAKGRSLPSESGDNFVPFLQTDAAVNPGNSGGPLLNSRGDVIGITTMIASNGADQSSGIGFAIPINTARAILDDYAKYGYIRRPSLDIVTLPIGPDIAEQIGLAADYGILIERVLPGGAAEKAGLHGGTQKAYQGNTPVMLGGDLIVALDGEEITSPQDLAAAMNSHRAGDVVTITVFRGRKKMDFKVTLGDQKDTQGRGQET